MRDLPVPAWFANRVYGDRARVTGLTELEDGLGTTWRIELVALRGSVSYHIERWVSDEMIHTFVGGNQLQDMIVRSMHAKLERDIGPSVSWEEFLASRAVMPVRERLSLRHGCGTGADCVTDAPDLLCACGAFVIAWGEQLLSDGSTGNDLAGTDVALVRVPALDDHGEAEADGAACRAMANALRAAGRKTV